MGKELFVQAIVKYLAGLLLLSALLFIPAGTLKFWNAWLLIAVLFIPMLLVGIVLAIKKPELLRKRLHAKEKEEAQKSVTLLGALMFIGGLVIAGLDYRFKWLVLPRGLVFTATAVFLLGYLLYVEVLRENAYLSRSIEVQQNQKVVDTGLYGIVRHPMYAATLLLFLSMPLVLGSLFSLVVFLLYPAILVKRIKNEEEVLSRDLAGYAEYKNRVKYRLIPFVW